MTKNFNEITFDRSGMLGNNETVTTLPFFTGGRQTDSEQEFKILGINNDQRREVLVITEGKSRRKRLNLNTNTFNFNIRTVFRKALH